MTDPVYINKDAEYLHSLGGTFIDEGKLEQGLHLRQIAAHLQSLDDKLQHAPDEYARGKHDAFEEFYDRSNLPVEERTISTSVARQLGTVPVKKVPTGMTAAQVKDKLEKQGKLSVRTSGLRKLGLSLNLAALHSAMKDE